VKPYLKKPYHKNTAGGVAQGKGPEFKPQYRKKKMLKELGCGSSGRAPTLLL
jgi:hypothetical protein